MNVTKKQAIEIVRRVFPQHSISVTESEWYHGGSDGSGCEPATYCMSIQPGLAGETCSLYYGSCVQECLEDLAAAITREFERAPVEAADAAEAAESIPACAVR